MERGRLLDVLDATYALGADPETWQATVVSQVEKAFTDNDGVLSFRYRLVDGLPQLTSRVFGDPRFMAVPDEGHGSVDMKSIYRAYTEASHAEPTTLFHANPVTGEPPADLVRMWQRYGVRDMLGVYATRPGGENMTVGVALPMSTTPEVRAVDWRTRRFQWGAIARHLENALTVRDQLERGVVADFDSLGRGDFAPHVAGERQTLVETAQQLEHHRDEAHQGSLESLDVWSRLLQGRWSIVRYQRQGGRMRYLAIENPAGDTLRALTAAEREVVVRAAAGQPNKVVAAELELHLSTVCNLLASGLRKLGLERRTHLPMLQTLLSQTR
jgi:DNA-binding CsgD family transcriptional regulator